MSTKAGDVQLYFRVLPLEVAKAAKSSLHPLPKFRKRTVASSARLPGRDLSRGAVRRCISSHLLPRVDGQRLLQSALRQAPLRQRAQLLPVERLLERQTRGSAEVASGPRH